MTAWIFNGEDRVDTLNPRDRGLAYGDGVFETILIHDAEPVWWDAHIGRLLRGCATLGIPAPDPAFLRAQSDALLVGCMRGVLKLIVTRGIGARGYASPQNVSPTVLLALSDAPSPPPRGGLNLRWCDATLAIQPRLAGIKHLNRLEQVLGRAEWNDAAIHEGLQRDGHGRVVGATSANLFVLRDGRWLTPPIVDCGIAGICRAWILEHVAQSAEAVLTCAEVESANALVLCNAVRGILPVVALGARSWSPHPGMLGLRQLLAEAHPAFSETAVTDDSPEDA